MPVLSELRTPITSITDNSGGTASDTIVVQGATYVQATQQNTIASLAAKINEILVTLRKWKIIATS